MVSIAIIIDAWLSEIRSSLCIWNVILRQNVNVVCFFLIQLHCQLSHQLIASIKFNQSYYVFKRILQNLNIIDIVSLFLGGFFFLFSFLLCHIKILIWISFDQIWMKLKQNRNQKTFQEICIRTNEKCQYNNIPSFYSMISNVLINSWSSAFSFIQSFRLHFTLWHFVIDCSSVTSVNVFSFFWEERKKKRKSISLCKHKNINSCTGHLRWIFHFESWFVCEKKYNTQYRIFTDRIRTFALMLILRHSHFNCRCFFLLRFNELCVNHKPQTIYFWIVSIDVLRDDIYFSIYLY